MLDGRGATLGALLAAFPPEARGRDSGAGARRANVALRRARSTTRGRISPPPSGSAATVPQRAAMLLRAPAGRRHALLARRRGDLERRARGEGARRGGPRSADTPQRGRAQQRHRAVALMNLGIAELWSLRLGDARRHLEQALALARRIGRPYVEIACLGHLALAVVLGGQPVAASARARSGGRAGRGPRIGRPSGRRRGVRGVRAARWCARGAWRTASAGSSGRSASTGRGARDRACPPQRPGLLALGQGRLEEALAAFRAAESQAARQPSTCWSLELRSRILQTQCPPGGDGRGAGRARDARRARRERAARRRGRRGPRRGRLARRARATGDGASAPSWAVVEPRCSTPSRVTGSATAAAPRRRSSARSISPKPTGSSCRSRSRRSGSCSSATRHRSAHATLLATILDLLAGRRRRRPSQRPGWTRSATPSCASCGTCRATSRRRRSPPSSVSRHTVRTHVRHIYAKLDAHDRTEAVDRARELALLAPSSRVR